MALSSLAFVGCAAGRDVRPAAQSLSLSRQRKEPKKGDPTCRVPFASLRGNLRCSRPGCRRRTHFALRAPFRQPRRVSLRSTGMLRCPCAPRPLRFSARPEGSWEPTRAIAALGLAHAARSACALEAERSDGPYGLQTPCGCACVAGLARWRVQRSMHALRRLTRRGCLNAAPQARSEFCGAPRKTRDAGLPRSAAKGAQTWGRFLCLLSCAHKKVGRPPGRTPGLRRQINNRRQPHTR